uniref:Uncharacterized protein n=1 Tax=Helianthus annuus TaxID=4232 RepID=A0A251SJY9_HELAN
MAVEEDPTVAMVVKALFSGDPATTMKMMSKLVAEDSELMPSKRFKEADGWHEI